MLYDPTRSDAPEAGRDACMLWRLMIASPHQRKGYGSAALALLIAHARTLPGVTRMRTSYVPRPGNASPLYERAGFRPTGEVDDGEIVLELSL
jgi:diamine N-acetyltransferase